MSAFLELEPFTTPLFEIPADADFEYSFMLAAGDFPLMDGDFLADQPPASAEVVAAGGDANGKRSFHADDGEAMGAVPVSRLSKRRRKAPSSSSSLSYRGGDGGEGNELVAGRGGGRRVWVRKRSTEWWDRMSDPTACPEADFRRAFRMPRAVFDKLCDDLAAAVAKEDTTLRSAIPVPQRVAVCLWRLATGDPLREVSRRFGLGISTSHNIILQVCAALTAVLLPRVVRWPDSHAAVASRFQTVSGIPGIVGAVHTEHIRVVAPREKAGEYYDRRLTDRNNKATYSIAMQAVVDADGAFTDVCIGHPGSLSDAAVLEKSALYALCEAGLLLGDGRDWRQPPQWLVGGASYPLTSWMLVPYTQPNLTWAQDRLNARVAEARAAAVGAFRRLRARWQCLRRAEVKLPELANMLAACCVLHNLCERSGHGLDADLLDLLDDELVDDGVVAGGGNTVRSPAAEQVRDRIAHGLLHQYVGNASLSG
ncbi:protein ALP1-like [Oryza glaberrima]|uniref:DDE Tnp4 domain-containing protein n=1 Tax=Oryza glaberrima TaxID=4538 RepID=I1PYL5_ORYGL|nr:protein ALP1-like [Oryza glaberrima]